jgi:hypothetical protein
LELSTAPVQTGFDLRRPGRENLFLRVPEGSDTFSLDISHPDVTAPPTGRRVQVFTRVYAPDNEYVGLFATDPATDSLSVSIPHPSAGVWQVNFSDTTDQASFDPDAAGSPPPPTRVDLTASIQGVELDASELPSRVYSRNRWSPIRAHVASAPLVGYRAQDLAFAEQTRREVSIEVPGGVTALYVGLRGDEASISRFDLYLFDCSAKSCSEQPVRQSRGPLGANVLKYAYPHPGKWRAVVHVPLSATPERLTFFDAIESAELGWVVTDDVVRYRASDESWEASVAAVCSGQHFPGRDVALPLSVESPDLHGFFGVMPSARSFVQMRYDLGVVPLGFRVIMPTQYTCRELTEQAIAGR